LTTVYSLALKTTINEIRNISPEISCAFVFKPDEVIAYDDNANPETIQNTLHVFNEMTSRADAVGGLDNMVIQGSNGRVNFMQCVNGFYLATVTSNAINDKTLFVLNRVLVPAVIKIVTEFTPKVEAKNDIETPQITFETQQPQIVESVNSEQLLEQDTEGLELILNKPTVHQFMVEKSNGILQSDAVRIDGDVAAAWNKQFEGKIIDHVIIETLRFKMLRCRFKPIKDSKTSGKGLVQIPDKIMHALEVTRGDLIMVKPIVESQGRSK
jgi:hypothetical protein